MKLQMKQSGSSDSSESDSEEMAIQYPGQTMKSANRKRRRGMIEKRRRDRINTSLTELKRLVPSAFEKQGSAKLEKAEILQMTVDYLRTMQQRGYYGPDTAAVAMDARNIGFRECAAEVHRFLIGYEGTDQYDSLRSRLLTHLQCCTAQRAVQGSAPAPPGHGGTTGHPATAWQTAAAAAAAAASGAVPSTYAAAAAAAAAAAGSAFAPPGFDSSSGCGGVGSGGGGAFTPTGQVGSGVGGGSGGGYYQGTFSGLLQSCQHPASAYYQHHQYQTHQQQQQHHQYHHQQPLPQPLTPQKPYRPWGGADIGAFT